jgi:phosphopantothenate---cysteine ligase (CTP)
LDAEDITIGALAGKSVTNMKCIVTAGPTYEELDEVRRMTNFSTGTLGTKLANYLIDQGHKVELLRGHYSTCQIAAKAQSVQVFTTTLDLYRRLKGMRSDGIGAIFHAAAVSDFTFGKIWRRGPDNNLLEIKSRKIPAKEGKVVAELKPTTKIIGHLRDWFPKATVVGWKYEVDGDRARAVTLGERQMKENRSDACVVNGSAYGPGFGLLTRLCACQYLPDEADLFEALAMILEHDRKE